MTNLEALKVMHRIQRRGLAVQQLLDIHDLKEEGENNMVDPKIAALITQFDDATDKIAARIQRLIDAGGLSPESQAALTAEVSKLQLLGQDPENPVPSAVA